MNSLQVNDARVLHDLANCLEPAEIYDGHGKFLGLFVPANLERAKQIYAKLLAMVERDGITRQSADPRNTVPNEVVLARLKALNEESLRREQGGIAPFTLEEVKAFMRTRPTIDGGPASSACNSQ
jgi:hypothetical protein